MVKYKLVEESEHLSKKINALETFINKAHAREVAVDTHYLELCETQLKDMLAYESSLKERMEYLGL